VRPLGADGTETPDATVTLTADDVLLAKLPSPANAAVIDRDPVVFMAALHDAVEPLNVAEQRLVEPSDTAIVPVGEPAPGEVAATVAV
jgi:hypothetical protein